MQLVKTRRSHPLTPLVKRGTILWLLSLCLLLSLLLPLVYFLFTLSWSSVIAALSDADTLSSLWTSIVSATLSTLMMGTFGVPLGYILARFAFPGRGIVSLALYLPLVFPPVVSGIVLLLLYGPYGPIGGILTNMGLEVDNTVAGVVIAQVFVAIPFVVVASRSAFESIDPKLEQVAATLGHERWSLFWRVSLPLARNGIIAGLVLGWLRAMGEFGATVVLAYHPYTLPVYTFVQLTGTGVESALPPAFFALIVSCLVVGPILLLQRRAEGPLPL
jgi:ABC-type sulfate transport system permease component